MKNKDLTLENSSAISLGKVHGRAVKPVKPEHMLSKHSLVIIMLGIEIVGERSKGGK